MTVAAPTSTIQPRRTVLAMPEYHPPLASRDLLRLDFNENTFAPSPRVMAIIGGITAESLTIYPEREHTERIVAEKMGLAPDQVLLTNGVDEAIHLLSVTFLDDGDEALVATPSFFMYDVSVGLMTSGLRTVQSGPDLQFPLERMLAAITDRTRMILVATPNNPTGATVARADLLRLAEAAPHAVLFVDEAYYHFHGESMLADVGTIPNLIVGRTFSKAYGLANLRVGMLAGDPRLMGFVRKASSPYNVNGIALRSLPAALDDSDYLRWYVDQIREGRTRIMRGLDALGVPWFPSEANFVLMKIGPKHKELVAMMREHGVLVRDRSSDPGCDGFVRITVGVAEQNERALEALAASLKAIGWTGYQAAHDAPEAREYE